MIIIFSVEKEKIHSALSMAEERTGEKKRFHTGAIIARFFKCPSA